MSVGYRIYWNHGTGGPIDYSAPLATVSTLSYVSASLSPSTDNSYVVHAFDQTTQLEEANSDARIRIILDALGNDITASPACVQSVSVAPALGGGGRTSWSYITNSVAGQPTSFLVNLSQGHTLVASASIVYQSNTIGYSWVFPGPLIPSIYTVSVISLGQTGLNSSPVVSSVELGISQTPFVIDTLTIS